MTVKAANAGKHLIVEKPLSLTFEDSKRMLEVVNSLDAAYGTRGGVFAADRSAETGKPVGLAEFA